MPKKKTSPNSNIAIPSIKSKGLKRRGPRSGYRGSEMDEKVKALCMLGLTNKQLAGVFDIHPETFDWWLRKFPTLRQAVNEGRLGADAKVAASLYKRATGYEFPEEKIFNNYGKILRAEVTHHMPPDTAAATFWLSSRHPDLWRAQQQDPNAGALDRLHEIVELMKSGPALSGASTKTIDAANDPNTSS